MMVYAVIGMYVIYIAGFIISAIYLSQQNKKLRQEVESQRGMLEDQKRIVNLVKGFADIYDPERMKKIGEMGEEEVRRTMDKEMKKLKEEYEEKLNKYEGKGDLFLGEYVTIMTYVTSLIKVLDRESRLKRIDGMPDSVMKQFFMENIEYFKQPMTVLDYVNDIKKTY
jgi:hypothetical protein